MDEDVRRVEWFSGGDNLYDHRPSDDRFHPGRNSFIEIWNYPSGRMAVVSGYVKHEKVAEWLARKAPNDGDHKPCGLRLMISHIGYSAALGRKIPFHGSSEWRDTFAFDEATMVNVMNRFHLPASYLHGAYLANGCYSRHRSLELAGAASDSHIGFIISPPSSSPEDYDFAFTWDAAAKITQGLLRVTSEQWLGRFLRGITGLKTLAGHPLALGAVLLDMNATTTRHDIIYTHKTIWDIQAKTGHVGAMRQNVSRPVNPQEYSNLSIELSFISQNISYLRRCLKSTVHLCDFLLDSIACLERFRPSSVSSCYPSPCSFRRDTQILNDRIRAAASKSSHHVDLFDHYQELCQIQDHTVYNLIAQRDVQHNIELAKDSKNIAAASMRDSSAMRSIAVLTMALLPGTFLSTLFATPLFDWDAESWQDVPKSRFWFYWAIAVPLTLMVLAVWVVWQRSWSKQNTVLDIGVTPQIPLDDIRNWSPPSSKGHTGEGARLPPHQLFCRHGHSSRLPMQDKEQSFLYSFD